MPGEGFGGESVDTNLDDFCHADPDHRFMCVLCCPMTARQGRRGDDRGMAVGRIAPDYGRGIRSAAHGRGHGLPLASDRKR